MILRLQLLLLHYSQFATVRIPWLPYYSCIFHCFVDCKCFRIAKGNDSYGSSSSPPIANLLRIGSVSLFVIDSNNVFLVDPNDFYTFNNLHQCWYGLCIMYHECVIERTSKTVGLNKELLLRAMTY